MEILIKCEGAIVLKPQEIVEFQGELKELTVQRYEQLKKSILTLGFSFPENVWLDPQTSKWMCLDGHQRLRTIKKMIEEGYSCESLPCSIVHADNQKQAKRKLLAAASQFGAVTGAGLYEFMSEADMDFKELTENFNFPEIDFPKFQEEFFETQEVIEGEDDVPEIDQVEPITQLGDIYKLGSHRLMCGDSTDILQVENLTGGMAIDMILTDPPYGMNVVKPDGNIEGNRTGKNGYGEKGQYDKKAKCGIYRPIIGDDKPFDPTPLLNLAELQIIFGANHFSDKLPTSSHWIVWNKEMPEGTDFSGAELAWTNIDKKTVKVFKHTWAGMTRQGNRVDELTKRVHPTQKPVGLFVEILNTYNPKSVLDLYGGSGSTLIACEKTARKCFMMELDPQYCDVIVARWEKFTGKKAEKA